ncbi:putative ribonuclease H-like domain-containing protein [Tanacetum coccineum]
MKYYCKRKAGQEEIKMKARGTLWYGGTKESEKVREKLFYRQQKWSNFAGFKLRARDSQRLLKVAKNLIISQNPLKCDLLLSSTALTAIAAQMVADEPALFEVSVCAHTQSLILASNKWILAHPPPNDDLEDDEYLLNGEMAMLTFRARESRSRMCGDSKFKTGLGYMRLLATVQSVGGLTWLGLRRSFCVRIQIGDMLEEIAGEKCIIENILYIEHMADLEVFNGFGILKELILYFNVQAATTAEGSTMENGVIDSGEQITKIIKTAYLHVFSLKWNQESDSSSGQDQVGIEQCKDELLYKNFQSARSSYPNLEGIDYDEVFAPVARIEAIKLFLAYASFMRFIVYQMDVKSVFLYGTIEEDLLLPFPFRQNASKV